MVYLLTVTCSVIYTELVGYVMHILLHSEKLPSLSKAHMLHHLRDYGPKKPLHREGAYINSAEGRTNFLGLGMEWFVPSVIVVGGTLAGLWALGVPWPLQILFTGVGILWGWFLFGHMHSAMHYTQFWMMKVPGLKQWYLSIRRLHDYHHLQISDDGRMLKNYGICFFWFDRLLGTYSPKGQRFNQEGYQAALVRYKNLLE